MIVGILLLISIRPAVATDSLGITPPSNLKSNVGWVLYSETHRKIIISTSDSRSSDFTGFFLIQLTCPADFVSYINATINSGGATSGTASKEMRGVALDGIQIVTINNFLCGANSSCSFIEYSGHNWYGDGEGNSNELFIDYTVYCVPVGQQANFLHNNFQY
jgi:hypothetical protein